MKITKKTNITEITERRIYVSNTPPEKECVCERCAVLMLTAQSSAVCFDISPREVYRLIERGELHFVETEAHDIFVCPNSMRTILRIK